MDDGYKELFKILTEKDDGHKPSDLSELLGCPFCGNIEVEDLTLTIHIHGEKADKYNVEGGTDEHIYCWNCGANALKRWWNRRAT